MGFVGCGQVGCGGIAYFLNMVCERRWADFAVFWTTSECVKGAFEFQLQEMTTRTKTGRCDSPKVERGRDHVSMEMTREADVVSEPRRREGAVIFATSLYNITED